MRAADVLPEAADQLRAAGLAIADLLTPVVRLGVTGLSRSGKTVFITSLVRNLTEGGRLPFLKAAAAQRIERVYLEPQPDDHIPRFEYERHAEALTGPEPSWPESTRRISQLRLTFEYKSANRLRRMLGPSRLHLDIVDYPGEWLLDLGLLAKDFETWSAETLVLARSAERRETAAAFLAFLDAIAPAQGAAEAEQTAIEGARIYTAYLKADRANEETQATQGPGRFLMPGEHEGAPMLTFFPLQPPADPAQPGALYKLNRKNFESYKSRIVEPFFREHFMRLDRQIVLVDALGALNRGGAAMAELERALGSILTAFRPGGHSWLALLTGARIDRLLFAATKADHLHHEGHKRLEAILKLATERASARASQAGAEVEVAALAAVRATREGRVTQGGQEYPVIIGTPVKGEMLDGKTFDGRSEAGIFPGDLPADPAAAFDPKRSRAEDHAFVRFRPPLFAAPATEGMSRALPHIRLDHALEFLIGDKLA